MITSELAGTLFVEIGQAVLLFSGVFLGIVFLSWLIPTALRWWYNR